MTLASVYEVRYTKDSRGCGSHEDFRALHRVLKGAEGYHGHIRVTYDEAVNILKDRKVKRFAFHFNHEGPSRTTEGYCRPCHGSVWVSRKEALEGLRSGYHYQRDRVFVEMSLHGDTIFVG